MGLCASNNKDVDDTVEADADAIQTNRAESNKSDAPVHQEDVKVDVKDSEAEKKAAVAIQRVFRGYRARAAYAEKVDKKYEQELKARFRNVASRYGPDYRRLFHLFDKDGNSELDSKEFYQLVRKTCQASSKDLSDAQVLYLFEAADKNDSGHVDMNELIEYFSDPNDPPPSAPVKAEGKAESVNMDLLKKRFQAAAYTKGGQDFGKMFRHYDTDNSGSLDYEEFRKCVRRDGQLTQAAFPDSEIEALFSSLEQDTPGKISLAAFTSWIADYKPLAAEKAERPNVPVRVVKQMKKRFRKIATAKFGQDFHTLFYLYAKDDRGYLTPADFTQCLRKTCAISTSEMSKADIDTLFELADTDNSGTIDIEEFLTFIFDDKVPEPEPILDVKHVSNRHIKYIKLRFQASSYTQGGQDFGKLFKQYDKDNSGMIDFAEFRDCVRKDARLEKKVFPDAHLKALFHSISSDGKKISIDEFTRAFGNPEAAVQKVAKKHAVANVKRGHRRRKSKGVRRASSKSNVKKSSSKEKLTRKNSKTSPRRKSSRALKNTNTSPNRRSSKSPVKRKASKPKL